MIHLALTAMSLALLDPAVAASAPNPPRQPTPAPTATKRAPTAATRYCTVYTLTGSMIPTRVCHTRSEWLDLGFDPLQRP